MPVCAAVCDFFTDGAAVCTNMPEAATLLAAHSAQLMPDAHEYWNTNTTIL